MSLSVSSSSNGVSASRQEEARVVLRRPAKARSAEPAPKPEPVPPQETAVLHGGAGETARRVGYSEIGADLRARRDRSDTPGDAESRPDRAALSDMRHAAATYGRTAEARPSREPDRSSRDEHGADDEARDRAPGRSKGTRADLYV